MNFSSISHTGLLKIENQDCIKHHKCKDGDLFIVCDGISGLPNGAKASKLASDSILDGFLEHNGSIEEKINYSMQYSQYKILKSKNKPLGTTVITCLINDDIAYVAWCGDSRIYHLRNNQIIWISMDHTILHDKLNNSIIIDSINYNPQALNRYFGRNKIVKWDNNVIKIQQNDKILLCTDGLSNFLSEVEILDIISNNSINTATNLMKKKLLSKQIKAPDNFSWYLINY